MRQVIVSSLLLGGNSTLFSQILFAPHTIVGGERSALSVISVYPTDLDGDDDKDLFSASQLDNKIIWWENIGQEYFVPNVVATDANGALSVYASDLDADGDLDVLSASYGDDKIAWYENLGNGSFAAQAITTNADGAASVFAADVDNDGDMDVLSASLMMTG